MKRHRTHIGVSLVSSMVCTTAVVCRRSDRSRASIVEHRLDNSVRTLSMFLFSATKLHKTTLTPFLAGGLIIFVSRPPNCLFASAEFSIHAAELTSSGLDESLLKLMGWFGGITFVDGRTRHFWHLNGQTNSEKFDVIGAVISLEFDALFSMATTSKFNLVDKESAEELDDCFFNGELCRGDLIITPERPGYLHAKYTSCANRALRSSSVSESSVSEHCVHTIPCSLKSWKLTFFGDGVF